jgi:hypothetical protein
MVKDLFGKWKKEEAITDYEDDHQQAEGKVILERMTSIIASDEERWSGLFGQETGIDKWKLLWFRVMPQPVSAVEC